MSDMENNKDNILNLCTKTWTRDSHGLYDYESLQVKPHEGNIFDNAFLVRKKMDIKLVKSFSEIKEEEFLFEIKSEKCKKIITNFPIKDKLIKNQQNFNKFSQKIKYKHK